MRTTLLGQSDLEVSVIGLGTHLFGAYVDESTAVDVIRRALDLGINFLDTSPLYGHSQAESIIGKSITGNRHRTVVGTKVGLSADTRADGSFGAKVNPLTPKSIRSSVERSLKRLNTDYIDLLQLHAFDDITPLEDTLGEVADLIEQGKVLALGCLNYEPEHLTTLLNATQDRSEIPVASCQCHYNLTERRAEDKLFPICSEFGVAVISNRVLASGLLTGKYAVGTPPPVGSRGDFSQRMRSQIDPYMVQLVDLLAAWASERGHTATQLALSWALSKGLVTVAIVGVRDVSQLEGCADATDWILNEEELAGIDQIISDYGARSHVQASPEVFFE